MLHLTRDQLREIDRRAVADYHIPSIVLMENAARAVTEHACRVLSDECCASILILCGGGNNGGDGLAVARHLHNRGANVTVGLCCDPASYKGDALINWKITTAMKIRAAAFDDAMLFDPPPMLVIDAIFGTGLTQAPRQPFGHIADTINNANLPILAVDVPSGLDCDTGMPPGACIRAHCTVTFVAEKVGFTHPDARRYLGKVSVGDIGCPVELIEELAAVPAASAGTGQTGLRNC
jgi:NAD(P)H-hydrate epimerase